MLALPIVGQVKHGGVFQIEKGFGHQNTCALACCHPGTADKCLSNSNSVSREGSQTSLP